MAESKRLNFLESYLKLFGVVKIELISEKIESIRGIAIYDKDDPDERQHFIWYNSENQVPSKELIVLIEKIVTEKLHNGDKISQDLEKMEFAEFDSVTKRKLLNELFDVQISMVDGGEETDSYFVHY